MAINIRQVAEHYAELPHQDGALQLLQAELSKVGLTNDTCEWVKAFRTEHIALDLLQKSVIESERSN